MNANTNATPATIHERIAAQHAYHAAWDAARAENDRRTLAALTAKAAALDALVEAVRCTLQAHVIDGIGGPVRRELNDALSAAKAAQVSK